MHREVSCAREKQTLLNKKKQRGENVVNFSVGDYVLRSRVDEKRVNKLLVTWVGPYMVAEAHPDSDLELSEELIEHVAAQGMIMEVKEIKEHRFSPMRHSWEPFSSMARDVSVLVERYVRAAADTLSAHWSKFQHRGRAGHN
ncbi:hypothetical protein PHMEG_00026597 [Phytophthora megakarya]|uniref:Chromo domain-containing protein n=1 Tax=Phytophthora megakarya TaxID=4795 RepID=A0A225VAM6_9STRA|nr:hypothetical protein PHMEG_00026597 [Phytophthora megakarya]